MQDSINRIDRPNGAAQQPRRSGRTLSDDLPAAAVRTTPSTSRAWLWASLAALGLLLGLDLGRSLIAHLGYRAPAALWQPAASEFADIDWPPAAYVAAGTPDGQRLYLEHCAVCHGPDGRGTGAAAPSMRPRPRDLTGPIKYKSTAADAPPSRDDLRRVVAEGLQAGAMPGFGDLLSARQIDQVVAFVVSLRGDRPAAEPVPVVVPQQPPATAAGVARGERLYAAQGCAACHGADLRGGAAMSDARGDPVTSRDLTAPWTFRGGARPADVYLRLSTGLSPSPMPSYAQLSAQQRWDLVAYLESRRRIAPGQPGAVLDGPGQSGDPLVRGSYLVRAGMCGLCHTEVSARGIYRDDHYLAGGTRVTARPHGIFISRNLTSDPATGLGRWSEDAVARAIRDGRTGDGRLLNVWSMPWAFLHALSPPDALAIARYLKTLPAVPNAIPQPLHFGAIETVVSKLWSGDLLLGRPAVISYAAGSFANAQGPDLARLQSVLVAAQWAVLALALLGLSWLIPVRQWLFGRVGRASLLGCSAGLAIYAAPMLGLLPAELIATQALRELPQPDTTHLPPERAALVARGRYLFSSASCALCHLTNGGGGLKLSGLPGTLYTANISSDPVAGIGGWSDAQIGRAIRSGISRNGRPLYWQAMPWDHFSNLDEEDVMALTAYLRALPPVPGKVPAARPPSSDDCAEYTAWTGPSFAPGCR